MDTTYYCSNVIRNTIYEPGLIRRTLNFLTNCDNDSDDFHEFSPVLYRQVNVRHPDSDVINSKSLHKALTNRIKYELDEKYPKLQKGRREYEKMLLECESENMNSYIHKLPTDIVDCEIYEFL